jgi:hypothetical protein
MPVPAANPKTKGSMKVDQRLIWIVPVPEKLML